MKIKSFLRKIIALGLMVSLALSCMSAYAATPEDVVGTPYERAISILQAFGIVQNYPDGTFKPEGTITRAELVSLVVRAMNFDSSVINGTSSFSDVSDEHWAVGAIRYATDLGIINGNGDGTFAPDNNVTYNEAIKIFVCMIGGGDVAESMGGYPNGYLTIANQVNITKGVTFEQNQPAQRGAIAQMVYNTMQAPTYKRVGFGANGSYELDESETLFSRMNAMEQQYGIVVANHYTRIDDSNGLMNENDVIINVNGNELLFDAGDTNAEELLGYEVEFYAVGTLEDSNDMKLTYIAPRNNFNSSIEIAAEDVIDFTVNSNIEYEDERGRQTTQRIASDAVYIYNGVYVTDEMLGDFDTSNFYSGSIKLLSRTANNVYDVIFINNYKHRMVTSLTTDVDTGILRINLKQETDKDVIYPPEIDLDDKNLRDRIYLDGTLLSEDELRELSISGGAAASIAESMDGNVKTIYLSTETIGGTVSEISNDGKFDQITVEDEVYKVSPDMSEQINISQDYWGLVLSFDSMVVGFLENENGNTVMDTTRQYGYLIKAVVSDEMDDTGIFQILQTNSEVETYNAMPKINYNGASVYSDAVANEIVADQLIIYKLNDANEITEIETAEDKQMDSSSTNYIGYTENEFTLDAKGDMYYQDSNPPTLNGDYRLDENTIVFYIPQDKKDGNGEIIKKASLDDYGVGDYTLFQREKTYVVEIYDNNKFKVPAVVVNRGFKIETDDIVPYNSSCFLIERIVTEVDEDGVPAYKMYGMENGEEVSMFINEDVYEKDKDASNGGVPLSSLKPGTVVQLLYNIHGEPTSYRLLNVYEESPMKETVINGSGYNVGLLISYGYANDVRKDVMTITTDAGKTIKSYSIAGANFYLYDTLTKTARLATYEDIKPFSAYGEDASKVFLRVNSQDVKDVIIYK